MRYEEDETGSKFRGLVSFVQGSTLGHIEHSAKRYKKTGNSKSQQPRVLVDTIMHSIPRAKYDEEVETSSTKSRMVFVD